MAWFDVMWVYPEDADRPEESNVAHVAQHGLTIEDVEHALQHPCGPAQQSRTSSRQVQTGPAVDGELIDVVYEWLDDVTIYPVTAYRLEE
jgi:uncharacterized DUF497 family protein